MGDPPANLWTSAARGDENEIMNYLEYYPRADINEQGIATFDDGTMKGIDSIPDEDSLMGVKYILVNDTTKLATALHFAVICGHENVIQMLKKFDADIHKKSLGCAVEPGFMAFVNGAYPIENETDTSGALQRTPLRKAIVREYDKRTKMFQEESQQWFDLIVDEMLKRGLLQIDIEEKAAWELIEIEEDEVNPLKRLLRKREADLWDHQMVCRSAIHSQETAAFSAIEELRDEPHVVVTCSLSIQGWRSDHKMYISRYTPCKELVERLEKHYDQRLQISFVAKHKPTEAQQSRGRLINMVQKLRKNGNNSMIPQNFVPSQREVRGPRIDRWLQLEPSNVHVALSYPHPQLKALPRYPFCDLPPERGQRKKLGEALQVIPTRDDRMDLLYDRLRTIETEVYDPDGSFYDSYTRRLHNEEQEEMMDRLYHSGMGKIKAKNQDWQEQMDDKIRKYQNLGSQKQLSSNLQSLVIKLHDESMEHKRMKMAELEETYAELLPPPPEYEMTQEIEAEIVTRVYYDAVDRKQRSIAAAEEKVYGVPSTPKKLTKNGTKVLIERQYAGPMKKIMARKEKYAVKGSGSPGAGAR
eukprot:TRINITY_DN4014_c0_g1_i1.p1 TRINITY_DN4014_c0_g1~~TRINITY_DN4014_c0_g1_i1.p1  ORF type:complete len:585 (-),score=48.36 TRINITY_DN4014_c0_g1_i1:88-1842(-)